MRGFVFLSWPNHADAELAERVVRAACAAGLRALQTTERSWCGVMGPSAPGVQKTAGGGLAIGELVQAAGRPWPDDAGSQEVASDLCERAWGRYVVIFRQADGQATSILRDPSGALEAYVWRSGDLLVIASSTPDWLLAAAPPLASIDWGRLSEILHTPAKALSCIALDGLDAVEPGEWLDLVSGERRRLWSAQAIARDVFDTREVSVRVLRTSLDHVVSVLSRPADGLAAEVSGGLDSAIVVGALVARAGGLDLALNTRSAFPETDERAYAREVAEGAGVSLVSLIRPDLPLTAEMFEQSAGDPRPSQNGRDVFNDMAVSAACREAGVNTLLTGKGGDALFFQGHTPLAFADLWQAQGLRSLRSPLLPGVARWTRTSAWSVLQAARQQMAEDRRRREFDEDEPSAPPAKRHQIALIQGGLAYYSACRRAEQVDMIHPLMTQPLIEWALRTPVADLVEGGRDRALARRAFADRLPDRIRARRSKGDYSAYFHLQVASNLNFLRDYLLNGRLAAERVLDRAAFDALLQRDALRWRGGAAEILAATSLEAWVRRWEPRLRPGLDVPTSLARASIQATL